MLRKIMLVALLAGAGAVQAQLPEPVVQALAAGNLPEDALSVLVLRGDTNVLSHLPERPMQPASTMKLVTTLIALEQLGPVFKGRTEIKTSAVLVKDVLKGDVILRGGADADLNDDVLERMLQSLRNQGIRKIDGRLVLDRQLFQPPRTDVGLAPFDESPEAYYNVIPDALLINKNMLQLDMRSTGSAVKVAMQPALDRVAINADFSLIDADCAKWEEGWKQPEVTRERSGKINVNLRGTFPRNCARTNSINVMDRQDYVDRLFRAIWKRLGGSISGETIEGIAAPDARVLSEHLSRSLPEVVRDVNKPSDNALARTLFLSLGSLESDAVLGSKPLIVNAGETTYTRADMAVRTWMRAQGIDDAGFVIENGSGLSRLERISAVQMAGLLRAGLRSKWAPEFQSSLPIMGTDGTLRRRLKESPAAQRARMKTGTLRNVVALAGYVPDAAGQLCVVVAFVNSEQAGDGKGRAVLDALVDWVARSDSPKPLP